MNFALWFAAVVFLMLPAAPSPAAAVAPGSADAGRPPDSLEALMSLFAESGGVRARFHETHHISLLADPIETEGHLYFRPPNELARHQTHPGNARFVVKDGRVSIRDETGERVVELGSSEAARTLIGNLTALLRGDLEILRKRYTVEFRMQVGSTGELPSSPALVDQIGWELDLDPRSKAVRAIVERIRVKGRGARLESMETIETNGDRTVAVLSNVETGIDFGRADLDWIFSLDADAIEP